MRRGQVSPEGERELHRVTLRKAPSCLALGLFASLIAHAALYGGEHAIAGGYHTLLTRVVTVAALGFFALLGALVWTQSGSTTDGSVLAARLRDRLPGTGCVMASAAAWYGGVEALEPHHAGAPAIALLGSLAVASYVALRLARTVTDVVARAAIAIVHTRFSLRSPAWRRRLRERLIPLRPFSTRRRFARPPPLALAFSRA